MQLFREFTINNYVRSFYGQSHNIFYCKDINITVNTSRQITTKLPKEQIYFGSLKDADEFIMKG